MSFTPQQVETLTQIILDMWNDKHLYETHEDVTHYTPFVQLEYNNVKHTISNDSSIYDFCIDLQDIFLTEHFIYDDETLNTAFSTSPPLLSLQQKRYYNKRILIEVLGYSIP